MGYRRGKADRAALGAKAMEGSIVVLACDASTPNAANTLTDGPYSIKCAGDDVYFMQTANSNANNVSNTTGMFLREGETDYFYVDDSNSDRVSVIADSTDAVVFIVEQVP